MRFYVEDIVDGAKLPPEAQPGDVVIDVRGEIFVVDDNLGLKSQRSKYDINGHWQSLLFTKDKPTQPVEHGLGIQYPIVKLYWNNQEVYANIKYIDENKLEVMTDVEVDTEMVIKVIAL